jgi:hypothetical protein
MQHPTQVPLSAASTAVALITAAVGPDDGTYEQLVAGLGVGDGSDADLAIRGLLAFALAAFEQLDGGDHPVTDLLGQLGLLLNGGRR